VRRGYIRADEGIREDLGDRLTDDPAINASEVEIAEVHGRIQRSREAVVSKGRAGLTWRR
jgi:hypothetical protein